MNSDARWSFSRRNILKTETTREMFGRLIPRRAFVGGGQTGWGGGGGGGDRLVAKLMARSLFKYEIQDVN